MWKKFAVPSDNFESAWEFEQYVRLAEPGYEALNAIGCDGGEMMVILAHEYMGVPTALQAMLDGVAFIARTAAKRRKKRGDTRKVVIHPVAIKYLFQGDLENAVDDVLSDIEHRLSWQPQEHVSLLNRITKVGRALLCLKELEYFGREQGGTFVVRLEGLINRLLVPLEEEWLGLP